ncbi:GAF domain-containing protein [Ensifer sp. 4252]|uniref:GAF domain-containing protein n=1 Tax=Ensifer sp. 4252 TaxID=3373915 RepID=UPI003D1B5BDC
MTNVDALAQRIQLAWGADSQPASLLQAADQAFAELVGHTLFTVTRVLPGRREIERLYSTCQSVYPVGGRKPMEHNAYADSVHAEKRPFLARTPTEFRHLFPDHETMTSLGIGSVINLPVVYDGAVLGTVNLHHLEWVYEDKDLEPAMMLARQITPAMLDTSRPSMTAL